MTDCQSTEESLKTRRTVGEWFRKYFYHVDVEDTDSIDSLPAELTPEEEFVEKYRKVLAFAIPVVVAQFLWWCTAVRYDLFALYATHWHMPATMVFGAVVAGMTSEGGGAIAFPVMTFILHMSPTDGRDFSIMMQAFGMSTALFAVLFMRLRIEWRAIVLGLVGSVPGNLFGFYYVDPMFNAAEKKMLFVSIWAAFAFALWVLNREKKRATYAQIQALCAWKAAVLLATGFVGGTFTAFAGSGLDICIFAVITLLFSVSEKNATPTTVVAMAISSLFCFYWRYVIMGDVSPMALDYLKVSIPVGVGLAPVGSFLSSFLHRQVLAHFVYVLEGTALIGFMATSPPIPLIMSSVSIMVGGLIFFTFLSKKGKQLLAESQDHNRLPEKVPFKAVE